MAFMKLKGEASGSEKQPNETMDEGGDGSDDSSTAVAGGEQEASGETDPKFTAIQTMVDELDEQELQFVCEYADQKLQEMSKERGLNDQGKEFDSSEYEKSTAPNY